ncbi:c-type cytochrome biogenesis protein CcmI [Rhodoferax sp.]|uniref:c-type cytochrome biogenesis protein CcmI n=1 Tax=Rhodoferax sp. TaxID=50421 RepID=UPI00260CF300|nr:c-type cytochrome biogenesis protein CcmI [Rhodoferax sp.]MDD2918822.1 c-type cytochrome biogenesis protein CcmI [Rhodoferax sp.]
MNVFIGISALLTLLVVAWVIRPLLVKPKGSGTSSEKLNAAIHRDQLQTLEGDLARGVISQQDFETTREELQLRLLDDTESFEAAAGDQTPGFWTPPRMAAAIGVSLPVLALGIYLQLGAPAAINPPVASVNAEDQQVTQMIDTLAAKLKANPDNPQGWAMMARSYKVVGRFEESKQAFERAGDFIKTNPDMLVDYAELLGIMAGNTFVGKPQQIVEEALRLNPEHPMGLMIAGVAAYQSGDFPNAVTRWEKLLGLLPPDSPDTQQIQANIADARGKAGMPAGASNVLPPVPENAAAGMTPEMINQMVDRLAARLKDNPDDLAGWARLARAYKVQGRLDEAANAYAKTGTLLDSDPDLLTQYADTLAMRAKNLQGKPAELVNKALTIDPKHPMALMMAGQAAFQSGNYAKAIGHWQTALTVLPVNSPDIDPIKAEIADAKFKMSASGKP